MRTTHIKLRRAGQTPYDLHGVIWDSETRVTKHVIHIVHGMTEHIGRYAQFAEKFVSTNLGIAIAGFDLRGHGMNAGHETCGSFISGGDPSFNNYGWRAVLYDIQKEIIEIKSRFPYAKHHILGFSLGSFLVRDLMREIPLNGISSFILVGTGYQPPIITNIMKRIIAGEIKKAKPGETTNLTKKLAFGTYNAKFEPVKTTMDWLCSDKDQLNAYMNDPKCKTDISADLFYEMLSAMSRVNSKAAYTGENDLSHASVTLISGAQDAVGDMGKGIRKLKKQMQNNGIGHVDMTIIPDARHDVFHEYHTHADDATMLAIMKTIGV